MKRSLCGFVGLTMMVGSAAWAADGAATYKEKCAKCHGDTGKSDTATGKSMKVPPIAGDSKLAGKSEEEIIAAIKENKKHKQPVTALPDEDLKATAGFVKKLAAGN